MVLTSAEAKAQHERHGGVQSLDARCAWSAVPPAERRVLELAWDACAAGTIGVGAVVLSEQGEIISAARNATRGRPAPDQLLSGTYMAHAEINALGRIPTERSLRACTLLTTLLPCMMCAGAAVMAHVGRIRYLADDPLFPSGFAPERMDEFVDNQWPHYEAFEEGEWSALALLLSGHAKAILKPSGIILRTHERREPEQTALLRWAISSGVLASAADEKASIEDVVERIWPELTAATQARRSRLARNGV